MSDAGTLAESACRSGAEAYGPKRFAAKLRNVGLPLYLPAGAAPNLSLILGGAGAAANGGGIQRSSWEKRRNYGYSRTIRCRKTINVAGAAWIIRRIMADEAQPLPDNAAAHLCRWRGKPAPVTAIAMRGLLALTRAISSASGRADPTARLWWERIWFCQRGASAQQVNNLLLAHTGRLPEDPRPQTVSHPASFAGRADRLTGRQQLSPPTSDMAARSIAAHCNT